MSHEANLYAGAAEEMGRLGRMQLELALDEIALAKMGEPAAHVHEARKRLKKARAVIALVATRAPRSRRRYWLGALRVSGRELAASRESAVMRDRLIWTLDEAHLNLAPAQLEAVHRHLTAKLGLSIGDRPNNEQAERACNGIRSVFESFLPGSLGPLSWQDVIDGLIRTHRRARDNLAACLCDARGEVLHELRKRTKEQLYQLRVLRPLWPAPLLAESREFEHLAELLGDHHDLCQLRTGLQGCGEVVSPDLAGAIDLWLHGRITELTEACLLLALRVFAESSRARRRRFCRLLNVARRTRTVASTEP